MLSSLISLLPSPLPASRSATQRSRRPIEAALHQHTATVTFTPEGIITEASPLFLAAVGYREAEVIGQHHRLFCSTEEAQSEAYNEFWASLTRGEHRAGRRITHVVKIANDLTSSPPSASQEAAACGGKEGDSRVVAFPVPASLPVAFGDGTAGLTQAPQA